MNYLKSEHLKFKRSIANKLIFIIPFLTAIFAWLIGGFYGWRIYNTSAKEEKSSDSKGELR